MRFIIFVCLLFCFETVNANIANTEPIIYTQYKYYEINTGMASQLLSNLNSASPVKQDGKTFHGYTEYLIKWNFYWKTTNGKCQISKVSTKVNLTITLPKMVNKNAENKLKLIWSKWYPALVMHENGHAKLAVKIAREIETSIKRLPAYSNCNDLESLANATGYKLMEKLKRLNKEYDINTNHGETEGAALFLYL